MRVSGVTVRDALPADADELAPRLRACDQAEVGATFIGESADAIRLSIEVSPICATVLREGRAVFVIGCAHSADGYGVPWLLATDEVASCPGALTKVTKHYVGLFLERWPVLLNYVDARNVASVRWLRRLGFEIHEPLAFGLNGEEFHPFTMGA